MWCYGPKFQNTTEETLTRLQRLIKEGDPIHNFMGIGGFVFLQHDNNVFVSFYLL